ncbi:type II toxin-antitoxin system VapC family toxin [Synechococcus sp. PCC 7336]|uniref:type II toxin-antitoxin system VapC family toxin n=1 Tax=Synechococcus sp. PCC 7336 TaxID=195250 RepID=UPI00034D54DA|nr:type II toxin-antitoxin system VapC family toxin [Synechococcus sp. PCC 7336]
MDVVLLDTDVFSIILKGASQARDYQYIIAGKRMALSFMTVAELFQWGYMRNWGSRRIATLETEMQNYLVLPPDIEACRIWAQVRARAKDKGRPISPQDAWNAAMALRYSLPLVTNNAKDYQTIDLLQVLTPL